MAVRETESDRHGAGVPRRSEVAPGSSAHSLSPSLQHLLPSQHRPLSRTLSFPPQPESTDDVDMIYKNSIKWLAYTPLSSMTTEEKNVIVRDLLYLPLSSPT